MDWIGFNIQGLVDIKQVKQIAEYLFLNFGFNSTFAIGPNGKQETLFSNSKNKYQVYIRVYKYSDIYWDGLKIDFSGSNAAQVYKFIQEQKLDWNIFQLSNLSLSRFDLCYFREIKLNHKKGQLKRFITNIIHKIDNNYKKNNLNYDQIYYLIEFNLKEYIKFLGVKKINQYQRNKFINLFYSLQKMQPLTTYFTDSHFQSLLSFPYLNIQKQGNSWVVRVAVSKLLYSYRYPFSFPNTFLTYKNIYDLKVKLEVIQAISKVPLEKVFYVEVFLEQFNVSTKNKAIIKKHIVKTFNQLQTAGIIKNNYKLIKKKKSQKIEQVDALTQLLVGQANIIYFYENIEDKVI